MKKLMFAALAVAGMSAVAAEEFVPVAVEKVQLSLKQVNSNKVDSVKYNGFIFWDTNGVKKAVVWANNSKSMIETNTTEKAFGKDVRLKKVYRTVNLGEYDHRIDAPKDNKKQGKAIWFGDSYLGYGSGSAVIDADLVKGDLKKIKESVSGNMVNINKKDGRMYGTWKMTFDKSTSQKLDGKVGIKDVLVKNKVEFWDL